RLSSSSSVWLSCSSDVLGRRVRPAFIASRKDRLLFIETSAAALLAGLSGTSKREIPERGCGNREQRSTDSHGVPYPHISPLVVNNALTKIDVVPALRRCPVPASGFRTCDDSMTRLYPLRQHEPVCRGSSETTLDRMPSPQW